ncbi:hypothetical protein GLAREA_00799 [Glarea lozoyensis ATCC 20868]|uniref:Telomere length regulation protein conserved domain-containing protein n=1 Tax=Glarea lozoyensis (strain ATCC 20868 / MF5171) TaxID=1116229 RepID=S3CXH7_GLAL2|nr:uncharacterized protein GLAREA_00799 [Glarea lozoyensis ATCC 20868]EPE29639.1 hypothetical protein GLAREA_00799 [Glarea lozoyensis ATCC 20868]
MDTILTPVSTTYRKQERRDDALIEVVKQKEPLIKPSLQATTPEEALEILKNEPDHEALVQTLRFLVSSRSGFDITSISSITSQLIHVLVTEILPSYWGVLSEECRSGTTKKSKQTTELELLITCLRSVPGLNALFLGFKRNIQLSKDSKKTASTNPHEILAILLQALEAILEGLTTIEKVWTIIWESTDSGARKKAIWADFLGLVVGGKLLGSAAEADDIVNTSSATIRAKSWVADSNLYGTWLAKNIRHWAKRIPLESDIGWKCCAELLSRSFRVGKTEKIVAALLDSMVVQSRDNGAQFLRLLNQLSGLEQRNVLFNALQILSKEHLSSTITTDGDSSWWEADSKLVSGAAGMVKILVANSDSRKNQLMAWAMSSSGAGAGEGMGIRRAVVAILAEDKNDIETVLEKSIAQFGDQFQILLLSAGWVYRKAPLRLSMMMRSGLHLNAVSNRLAASSTRARFLGMVVGEALSSLVDKGENKMDFKVDEMQTTEAKWYKSMVNVADKAGELELLRSRVTTVIQKSKTQPPPAKKPSTLNSSSKISSIEEIESDEEEGTDNSEDDDDDLVPYGKPESDAEDSDEDATNVVRNKPTAPVYIRNLITYLRNTESYDHQKLGLSTAASLIRRKANFGTEVSAHAEELATLLVGIQDKYDIEEFQELRLQGMIAVLIALPSKMGPWFARTFFEGDYSMSQRAAVLTTLGLGAREIGGFGKEDAGLTKVDKLPNTSFPSKTLPPAMHKLYISNPPTPNQKQPTIPFSAITTLTTTLTKSLTQPIAASALASTSGPALMNITPLSTRRITTPRTRPKPTTNALSTLIPTSFFFPLTGRFFIHLRAYGTSTSKNITFSPSLLTLYLKTLALILDAAGPNTPSLPQITSEFWDLLLTLRTQATDISVLEALLFAFLVLFEVNGDKRAMVEVHGRQLLETQEWVEGVFNRLGDAVGVRLTGGPGGGAEEEKVRALAASVLVRIRECVEKYQVLLMGDMATFS